MVYIVFYTIAMVGMGYFNTVVWAVITDVIDDTEVRTGVREDGTVYSVYSFARKLGQALSSGLTGALLSMIGYSEATAFDPAVTESIFKMSCIAPIIGFVALGLILIFLYLLSKSRVEEIVAALYTVVATMLDGENLACQTIKEFLPFMFHPDIRYFTEPEFGRDIPVSMLEHRYKIENQILQAVATGDETAALVALNQMDTYSLGERFIGKKAGL